MALLNLGTTLGSQFSTQALRWMPFYGVYILGGAVQLAITLLVLPIDPGEARRKLPLPEGTKPSRWSRAALVALLAFLIVMTVRSVRTLL
jgi:hypothetical protein